MDANLFIGASSIETYRFADEIWCYEHEQFINFALTTNRIYTFNIIIWKAQGGHDNITQHFPRTQRKRELLRTETHPRIHYLIPNKA